MKEKKKEDFDIDDFNDLMDEKFGEKNWKCIDSLGVPGPDNLVAIFDDDNNACRIFESMNGEEFNINEGIQYDSEAEEEYYFDPEDGIIHATCS